MSALVLMLLLGADAAPVERPETYTVRAGDTCTSITARFWGPAAKVDELHKYNNLGPTPHTLVAGQVLRLRSPQANEPDATLTFLKPSVRARSKTEWEPATLGMGLFRLNEVNTMRHAGAELTLRDSSQLLLDENALVVIYGEPNAQQVTRGPAIVEGEVRIALSGARAVELPGGGTVTAIKADGVTAVDGAKTGRVSIFDGDVVVEAQKVAVKLGPDQGTVVRSGAPPLPARPLPKPPELEALAAVVVADRSGLGALEVSWKAAENAERYRVQLAREPRFLDLIASEMTSARSVKLENLPPGTYLLRVIAFDAEGLQGRASPARPVDVVVLGGGVDGTGVVALRSGETPTFVAPQGYTLAPEAKALPAGHHTLEVRNGDGQVLAAVPVSVRPEAPKARVEKGVLILEFTRDLAPGGGLSVVDAKGEVPLLQTGLRRFESTRALSGRAVVKWDSFDLTQFDN